MKNRAWNAAHEMLVLVSRQSKAHLSPPFLGAVEAGRKDVCGSLLQQKPSGKGASVRDLIMAREGAYEANNPPGIR